MSLASGPLLTKKLGDSLGRLGDLDEQLHLVVFGCLRRGLGRNLGCPGLGCNRLSRLGRACLGLHIKVTHKPAPAPI